MNQELKKLKPRIRKVLRKYKISKAGVFGSYATGNIKKKSDIDILIKPPNGIGFGFVGIQLDLEKELNRKVDLVSYDGIHPLLKKRILKEEIKIL